MALKLLFYREKTQISKYMTDWSRYRIVCEKDGDYRGKQSAPILL